MVKILTLHFFFVEWTHEQQPPSSKKEESDHHGMENNRETFFLVHLSLQHGRMLYLPRGGEGESGVRYLQRRHRVQDMQKYSSHYEDAQMPRLQGTEVHGKEGDEGKKKKFRLCPSTSPSRAQLGANVLLVSCAMSRLIFSRVSALFWFSRGASCCSRG